MRHLPGSLFLELPVSERSPKRRAETKLEIRRGVLGASADKDSGWGEPRRGVTDESMHEGSFDFSAVRFHWMLVKHTGSLKTLLTQLSFLYILGKQTEKSDKLVPNLHEEIEHCTE